MRTRPGLTQRMTAAFLIFAVSTFWLTPAFRLQAASPFDNSLTVSGEMFVDGTALLNELPVISGATVSDGATIRTAPDSTAIIYLRSQGRISLAPASEIKIALNPFSIEGVLKSGSVTVTASRGTGVSIRTNDGSAVTDGSQTATLRVSVACGTRVRAEGESAVQAIAEGRIQLIAAGTEASLVASNAALTNAAAPCSAEAVPQSGRRSGLSSGALLLLILAGVGGAVTGIILANRNDDNSGMRVSNFRP